MIIKAESGLADYEDGIVLDALSSRKSHYRDLIFTIYSKKDAFHEGFLHVSLEDFSSYEVFVDVGKEFFKFNDVVSVSIAFKKESESKKMLQHLIAEGKDWHDYLHGIKDAETLQSITYRAFELAESAIKAAIAQAIEEQFND